MNVRILLVCLVLAPCARAAERDVKQAFAVKPGCTVDVDLYRGGIVIEESDEPEVKIAVHLEIGVDTEAEADRARASLQLELESENNRVSVRARNPAETGLRFFWNDKYQIALSCKITVPRECSVVLRTGGGSILVGSLTGRVSAHTEAGIVSIRRIDGAVDASTQAGSIILSRCSGAATLKTLQGTIRVGTIGGPANLKNTTGDIEVLAARAGITAYAEAGDVNVGYPRDFSGGSDLHTSGGSITAKIDPAASCAVQASAVWGHVQDKLPLVVKSGGSDQRTLDGRLNEGGPLLRFHASGGDVRLMPGETYFDE